MQHTVSQYKVAECTRDCEMHGERTHVVLHVLLKEIDKRFEVAIVVRHDHTHVVVNTDFAVGSHHIEHEVAIFKVNVHDGAELFEDAIGYELRPT